jgi:hypothetical protein
MMKKVYATITLKVIIDGDSNLSLQDLLDQTTDSLVDVSGQVAEIVDVLDSQTVVTDVR